MEVLEARVALFLIEVHWKLLIACYLVILVMVLVALFIMIAGR